MKLVVSLSLSLLHFTLATSQPNIKLESFIKIINNNSDSILKFFAVKIISIYVLQSDNSSTYDHFITEFLKQTSENYTYNIISRPPTHKSLKLSCELQHEGFVIATSVGISLKDQSYDSIVWPRNGYYFVLLLDAETEAEITQWLREMWSTVNAVTVLTIFRGLLWTYQPFKQLNGTYGRIELFSHTKDINPNYKGQIIRNLHGFPLRVELFEASFYTPLLQVVNGKKSKRKPEQFVGPDKETIDILQSKMNFTAVYQKPDTVDPYGSKLSNGTFTGSLGRIVYKHSDLVAVGCFIKDYLSKDLEFSVGIYSDHLCCVTKKALRIPPYLLPTICFDPLVWLSLCLITAVSAIIYFLLRNTERLDPFQRYRKDHFAWQRAFVDSVMIMLSSPMRSFPSRTPERAFVASMCLVSLVFVSIFQTSLSVAFIKPVFYEDINTLEDLAESTLKIGIKYAAMLDDIFPLGSTGMVKVLRDKMILTNSTSSLMEEIATEGQLVAITRKEVIDQSYAKYFEARQVHLVPQCPRSYNLGFIAQKNLVFMERVNEVLLQLNNGGFHVKWIRDMHFNYSWITLKEHGSFYEESFKVLTVEDLQLPYFLLGVGCAFAAIVFVMESIHHHLGKWPGIGGRSDYIA